MSTGASGFDLRRLVSQAAPLVPLPPISAKNIHPLGFGLRNEHTFDLGNGVPKVRLPKEDAAVARILHQVARIDVPELTPDLQVSAWHALLSSPTLVIPLAEPTAEDLLLSGIEVSSQDVSAIRAVGLAAVVRSESMSLQAGELHSPPYAAWGRLHVLTKPGAPHISTDGWIDITWTMSTAAFVRGLQGLYEHAQPSIRSVKNLSRIGLLVGEEILEGVGDGAVERLKRVAAVHKFSLEVYAYSRNIHRSIKSTLQSNPPSVLLVAIGRWAEVEDLIETFRKSGNSHRVRSLRSTESYDLDSEFCEVLCGLAGVNAGLLPLEFISEDSSASESGESLPDWPIVRRGERRRHDSFGEIIENKEDGKWYVRDTAGHADCRFKRYTLKERTLIHDADLDKDGHVIPKHKGPRGKTIDFDQTFGLS